MVTEILLPQRGMGMKEATIVHWYVKEGDYVEQGTKLVDFEFSKATDEIVSPVSGFVTEIRYEENEEVEVGEILALLSSEAETTVPEIKKETGDEPQKIQEPVAQASGVASLLEMTRIRQMTADKMLLSVQNTAQLTLQADADVTETVKRREALKLETGVTYTDILVSVVAQTIKKHPKFSTIWEDGKLFQSSQVNIGVAVDIEDGLVVPVVFDADQKSLQEIHRLVSELAEKARTGGLTSADLSGGVFTITNLGKSRVDHFTPILNPPETGILGIGRIAKRALVVQDEIAIRSVMGLSLTFDHRVVDGSSCRCFPGRYLRCLGEPRFLRIASSLTS